VDNRLREQLLGYLLGALDPNEIEVVEQLLRQRPELHRELDALREMIDPLDDLPSTEEPPQRLAERTCSLVDFHARRDGASLGGEPITSSTPHASVAGMSTTYVVPSGGSHGWTALDMFVALGVCLSLAFLFLPALMASRDQARTLQCQRQLSSLGLALHTYYDQFESFPAIPKTGDFSFSGMFACSLRECGMLPETSTLICPASPLADSAERWAGVFTVREALARPSDVSLAMIQQSGGSYGYSLGVVVDGQYETPGANRRHTFTVMGDGSWVGNDGFIAHGNRGRNLLKEDGSVQWINHASLEALPDHPYRNIRGQVSAGLSRDDSVLGDSAASPFPIRFYGVAQ
jgi:hypothetical protein